MMSKMRRGFACPFLFCDQICSRKWNMKVHLKRKHYGQGQPVDLSKIKEDQYGNNNNLLLNQQSQPLQHSLNSAAYSGVFPHYYYQRFNPYYYPYNKMQPQKENTKPYSTSDFIEKTFLEPLRQLREFKQLLDDICPIPQQQQYYFHPAMWTWQNYPYVNGNNNSNYNWSSIQRIVDPSYLVFGYKARMCNYCSEPKLERVLYKDDTNKATDDEILHKYNTTNHLQGSKPYLITLLDRRKIPIP
jgi:hypothetical protein